MENVLPITGVGSLPFYDSQEGYAFVRQFASAYPYVPQFPKCGRFSQMVFEPFEGGFTYIEEGSRATIRKGSLEDLLRGIEDLSPVRKITSGFCSQQAHRYDRLKTQIIGPYTFGTQVFYGGSPLLSHELGRRFIVSRLSTLICNEAAELRRVAGTIEFVFDEPGFAFMKRNEVGFAKALFEDLFRQISKDERVSFGLHSCAPLAGAISEILLSELHFHTLSLAFEPFVPIRKVISTNILEHHFKNAGEVIWGLYPTARLGRFPDLVEVASFWLSEIRNLGTPLEIILAQSAVSPVCGLGMLERQEAVEICLGLQTLREILLKKVVSC